MSKDDFKYYDKIKIGAKFRYFYSKEEYDAYMNNKLKDKSPFKAVSNFLGKFGKKTINEIKSKVNDGKSIVDKILGKFGKKMPEKEEVPRQLSKEELENLYVDQSNKRHNSKYIYKEKLPNGKFRYFYSEKEHQTYLDKLQYQKESPSFMSKVKRTLDLVDRDVPVLTEEEDTKEVNEKYNKGIKYQENCILSTAAYELRRRGYDVEAKPDQTNGQGFSANHMKEWYENAKPVSLNSNGISRLFDKGTDYDKPADLARVTKAILKNNPPGSRGNISVGWKGLDSGHSLIYEVDESNNIIIRDAQIAATSKIVTPQLPELLTLIDNMAYVRTDNLKLKPGILEVFNDN